MVKFTKKLIRNKSLIIGFSLVSILLFIAVFASIFTKYSPYEQRFKRNQPPSFVNFFGTDGVGRDVFSRVIYATRVSLSIGFLATTATSIIGLLLGLFAGYFGGILDIFLMRICDFVYSLPSLLLSIGIMVVIGPGYFTVFLALTIVGWTNTARIIRSVVLGIKNEEYVQAAIAIGASKWRIIFIHILPNCISHLIVTYTIGVASAILTESSLSFLGIGIKPPMPSWGAMMSLGKDLIDVAPWLTIFPGVAIATSVLGFNLLGDGLRDLFSN